MGGWEKFQKKKKKRNPVQCREKKKLQIKTEIRAEKGQTKNSTWGGTGIEKRILSVHHPSTLGAASLWPYQPPYTANNLLW